VEKNNICPVAIEFGVTENHTDEPQ